MDASATGQLEWCTAVCSLVLIAISLFLIFIYYFCKCRPFTEVGCSERLTAVQMPVTRETRCGIFFGFRSSRCGKSSACWLGPSKL